MSTDRELLEMAAKAAGMVIMGEQQARRDRLGCGHIGLWVTDKTGGDNTCWNPLEDDGDALRLAVKLGIDVYADIPKNYPGAPNCAEAQRVDVLIIEDFAAHNGDIYAATRRAIVRAAAEIGRNMP